MHWPNGTYVGYMLRYDGNETPNLEMRFTKANTAFCCFERFGVTRHICHKNLSYVSSIRSYCLFFCMQVKCGRSILKLVVLFAHGIAEKCHLSLRDLTEMNVFLLL